MKDTIYTIPLTDAFNANDECPFCVIHRNLEQDAISFTLGASYMEDDFRALTDQAGFCPQHYAKLYEYGNRLGLALILQTHYQSLIKDLSKSLSKGELPSLSFLQKLKGEKNTPSNNPLYEAIKKRTDTCFICDRINDNMVRYYKTFFHLLNTSEDFRTLFTNSKGFCLEHYSMLLQLAPKYLDEQSKSFFIKVSSEKLLNSLNRIEEDLSWFIDKHDYRNSNAPWKNAQDALPRAIQKVSGRRVQDPPYKSTK